MSRIFISYRRDDSAGYAGRLYDRLSEHFGPKQIFMDIDTIEPGVDFVEVIEKAVGSCDVLIALIGRQWLTITDAAGHRRLDNPEDFVRLEIATALDRNIRVIPVLVQGATMPRSMDLPNALKKLSRRNALEISDTRFHYDVDRLIETLEKVLGVPESPHLKPEEKAPATISPPKRERATPARLPLEPEMIFIPASQFVMGTSPQQVDGLLAKDRFLDREWFKNEIPQHTLYLPDYYIAKTPVTNAQYAAFVEATSRDWPRDWRRDGKTPKGKKDHPVVWVSWHDAVAYCHWLSEATGKLYRLPSEAEWEKAARGTGGRIYPWDNQWDAKRCNIQEGGPGKVKPVGAYPEGASPYGVLDMAGNVREWTRSLWGKDVEKPDFKYPYDPADGRENLEAPDDVYRVARGGSWQSTWWGGIRCASRSSRFFPTYQDDRLGFRVVMSSS